MVMSAPHDDSTGFRGSDLYAMGWQVSNYRGEIMYWHTGGLPGMASLMLYLPNLQWGTVLMANSGDGSVLQVLFHLVDDKLGIPLDERFDWGPGLELKYLLALETLKNAGAILFPRTPKGKDAIPLPLSIQAYTGVCHPMSCSFISPHLADDMFLTDIH